MNPSEKVKKRKEDRLKEGLASATPKSSVSRLNRFKEGPASAAPKKVAKHQQLTTGPFRAKQEITQAFHQARDERIKKKVEDRRRMHGSGGSHGF